MASLEIHTVKDCLVLIYDSGACTSNKTLSAIFLYTHVGVSVQISGITVQIAGQILKINIQKMVHKVCYLTVIWEF